MIDLNISVSSGKEFIQHLPIRLDYLMSFGNIVDFLVLEAKLIDTIKSKPTDVYTFVIQPTDGSAIKFEGILYNIVTVDSAEAIVQLYFVSKYYSKLMAALPLFGSGKVSDIIGSFYSKATVPKVVKDNSDVTLDNVLFQNATTIDEAISYLLSRSMLSDGYMVTTVVGESAYIRDIHKGTKDISGLIYTIGNVVDNRHKVDVEGGLELKMTSNAEEDKDITTKQKDSSTSETIVTYDTPDKNTNRAKAQVAQARVFYSNFTASLAMIGWVQLIGSNISIQKDEYQIQGLVPGSYFVNSQTLSVDFNTARETSNCNIQLIKELQ